MATVKRLNFSAGKFSVLTTSIGILSTCYEFSAPSANGKQQMYDTPPKFWKGKWLQLRSKAFLDPCPQ
jgi:hypothetical protein